MTPGPSAATLTLLEKLAVDNGFDRELPREGEWLAFGSRDELQPGPTSHVSCSRTTPHG